jgi:transcriptional regulator with XRE-family HTH domain
MTLGERILILRRRLGLSQNDLAEASDLDKNTIARLEQGRVHDLSGAAIVRVARALHVSTDVLLGVKDVDAVRLPTLQAMALEPALQGGGV